MNLYTCTDVLRHSNASVYSPHEPLYSLTSQLASTVCVPMPLRTWTFPPFISMELMGSCTHKGNGWDRPYRRGSFALFPKLLEGPTLPQTDPSSPMLPGCVGEAISQAPPAPLLYHALLLCWLPSTATPQWMCVVFIPLDFYLQTESDTASEISFQFNRHRKTPSMGSHSSDMASVSSVRTQSKGLLSSVHLAFNIWLFIWYSLF